MFFHFVVHFSPTAWFAWTVQAAQVRRSCGVSVRSINEVIHAAENKHDIPSMGLDLSIPVYSSIGFFFPLGGGWD
jgi:hypothetical protein